MTAPGTIDAVGSSHLDGQPRISFDIPTWQAPGTNVPILGGTNRDMGSLALFIVANWFVNGETVLIDGGVSFLSLNSKSCTEKISHRRFCVIRHRTERLSVNSM